MKIYDSSLLRIEKRFLKSLVNNYEKVERMTLTKDFLTQVHNGVIRAESEILSKLKEPLPFVQSSKYEICFDFTKLKDLKPATIKLLKEIYRRKRASMLVYNYIEDKGYYLNVAPVKMSLLKMSKGSEMASAGFQLASNDYLKGQSFLTSYESNLLRGRGLDIYFDLLCGKKPRKPIKINTPDIKKDYDLKTTTVKGMYKVKVSDKLVYIFTDDMTIPKVKLEALDGLSIGKLSVYYRDGSIKYETFVEYKHNTFLEKIAIGGLMTTTYDEKGIARKESYFKRKSLHRHNSYSYADNSISISKMFKKLDPDYQGVMTKPYQKALLKLVTENGQFSPQGILKDIKKKTGIDYKDFAEDKASFVEVLALSIQF